jgi:hypothetical protein
MTHRSNSKPYAWALLLALALLSMPAFAQSTTDPINWNDVSSFLNSMRDAGYAMSGIFYEEGMNLAGAFFTMMIAFNLFQMAIGVDIKMRRELVVVTGFATAVMLVLMNSWTPGSPNTATIDTRVGAAASANFSQFRVPGWTVKGMLVDSFDGLRDKVVAQAVGASTTDSGPVVAAKGAVKAWTDIQNGKAARDTVRDAAMAKMNIWDKIGVYLAGFTDTMVSGILGFFIALGFIVLILAFFITVFYGDLLSVLGMIVGPLMVPALMFPPLNWLWQNWLKYMIQAGFYKIISGVFIVLSLTTITQIQSQATLILAKAQATPGTAASAAALAALDVFTVVLTIFYLALAIWMMWKVHVISDMLVAGSGVGKTLNFVGTGGEVGKAIKQALGGGSSGGDKQTNAMNDMTKAMNNLAASMKKP